MAEYKSKHKLSDEEYQTWLAISMEIIQKVFNVDKEAVFLKLRERQKESSNIRNYNNKKKNL